MLQRTIPQVPPTLVFRGDYSEFVQGQIDHGSTVTILYDPRRIVPPGTSYSMGDPNQPIRAFLRFQDGGPITTITLVSLVGAGAPSLATSKSLGPMLNGTFQMPGNSDIITIWFSFTSSGGQTYYDSDLGQNYVFHLHHASINVISALVSGPLPAASQNLSCQIAADQEVSAIQIVYSVSNIPGGSGQCTAALHPTDQRQEDDRTIWTTDTIAVPCNAVVVFDVLYVTEGKTACDDHQNMHYIACTQQKLGLVSALL